jgi:hypothetical protein
MFAPIEEWSCVKEQETKDFSGADTTDEDLD